MTNGSRLLAVPLAALTIAACSLSSGVGDLQGGGGAGAPTAGAGGGAGSSAGGAAGAAGGAAAAGGAGGAAGAGGAGGAAGATGGAGAGGGGEGGNGGGGGRPACGSTGVFCDDFEGKVQGQTWTDTNLTGVGMSLGALAPGNGSTQALLAKAAPSTDNVERKAMLLQGFGASRSVHCEVDFFIEEHDSDVTYVLTFSALRPGFTTYVAGFALNREVAGLEVFLLPSDGSAQTFEQVPVGKPLPRQWVRLGLEASEDSVRLFYAGAPVAKLNFDLREAAAIEFQLGITSVNLSGNVALAFDDLACDFR